jgi:hypothetical protein
MARMALLTIFGGETLRGGRQFVTFPGSDASAR